MHVGVFSLQVADNLRTLTDTLIRWKPAITFGTSGLLHDQDTASLNGALFMCNDSAGGGYSINVQMAITEVIQKVFRQAKKYYEKDRNILI